MLTLSSPAVSGNFWPRASAQVAKRSLRQMSWSLVVPGFTRPGQRTMNGTRWPPSKMSALVPRNWALGLCPWARSSSNFASGEQPLIVPENAVVVPGARAVTRGKAAEWGLSLYSPVIVKYRDEKTDRGVELEDVLR